jgi:hypothetical protein
MIGCGENMVVLSLAHGAKIWHIMCQFLFPRCTPGPVVSTLAAQKRDRRAALKRANHSNAHITKDMGSQPLVT